MDCWCFHKIAMAMRESNLRLQSSVGNKLQFNRLQRSPPADDPGTRDDAGVDSWWTWWHRTCVLWKCASPHVQHSENGIPELEFSQTECHSFNVTIDKKVNTLRHQFYPSSVGNWYLVLNLELVVKIPYLNITELRTKVILSLSTVGDTRRFVLFSNN